MDTDRMHNAAIATLGKFADFAREARRSGDALALVLEDRTGGVVATLHALTHDNAVAYLAIRNVGAAAIARAHDPRESALLVIEVVAESGLHLARVTDDLIDTAEREVAQVDAVTRGVTS